MPAPTFSRRSFLGYSLAVSGGVLVATATPSWARTLQALPTDLFTLGVASGDPAADGMVLWTRLAPMPLDPDGGMPGAAVDVEWQLASDEAFTDVVRSGTVTTTPDVAHSVHVEVTGLAPDRWWWYRFRAGGQESQVGRTRTMPATGATPQLLRFGVVGCQNYEQGLYSAYANLAREDLDLVLHTGDYLYEGGGRSTGLPFPVPETLVRSHAGGETLTLDDYRVRHAQYKTDLNLQAAHAAFPFVVTTDDHEVENNYADEISENDEGPTAEFVARRAAAYQAYYEHMPLRAAVRPSGADLPLYRGLEFGQLARFNVLDTRQYRSDQPCGDGLGFCPERMEPGRTLMGSAQEAWLHDRLRTSPAVWNVMQQQVVMASFDYNGAPGQGEQTALYNLDSWDGYDAERGRLMEVLAEDRVRNPITLTGDVHSFWANDLKLRYFDDSAPVVGSEFVGTSITSVGIPTAVVGQALADNPHTKFYNGELHGYLRCTVTPDSWTTDYRAVPTARVQDEPAFTLVTFVTEQGQPGVQLDGVGGLPGEDGAPAPSPSPSGSPSPQASPSGAGPRTDARALPATGAGQLAVAGAMVLGGAVVARRFLVEDADSDA